MSTLIRTFSALLGARKPPCGRFSAQRCTLRAEMLEERRLLAATNLGIVEGTVFVDLNAERGLRCRRRIPGSNRSTLP